MNAVKTDGEFQASFVNHAPKRAGVSKFGKYMIKGNSERRSENYE